MSDPLTPNVGLAIPLRGTDVGVWDIPVNGDFTLIDSMLGSVTTIALSSTNVVLASSQAQSSIIRLTGTLTANVIVSLPAIFKGWTIDNQITNSPSSFAIAINNIANTLFIGAPPGVQDILYDGTTIKHRNLGKLGELWEYIGAVPPSWIGAGFNLVPPYLNCDGTTFSSAVYPQLANLLGGNTLPDARGRSRATLNQGTSRITSSNGGVDGNTNLAAGGGDTQTLTLAQLPTGITTVSGTVTVGAPSAAPIPIGTAGGGISTGLITSGAGAGPLVPVPAMAVSLAWSGVTSLTGTGALATSNNTSGLPHPNVQPTYIGGITLIKAI